VLIQELAGLKLQLATKQFADWTLHFCNLNSGDSWAKHRTNHQGWQALASFIGKSALVSFRATIAFAKRAEHHLTDWIV
jgi:hypothetical protein